MFTNLMPGRKAKDVVLAARAAGSPPNPEVPLEDIQTYAVEMPYWFARILAQVDWQGIRMYASGDEQVLAQFLTQFAQGNMPMLPNPNEPLIITQGNHEQQTHQPETAGLDPDEQPAGLAAVNT